MTEPSSGDREDKNVVHLRDLRNLLEEFVAYARWHAAASIALMGGAAVLEGAGLMLLVPLLHLLGIGDDGSPPGAPVQALAGILERAGFNLSPALVLAGFVLLIVIHSLLGWRRDIVSARLQQGFLDHLRQRLFLAIGSAEWAFLARTRSADFSHSLTTDLGRINLAVHAVLQSAATGAVAVAYTAAALYLSPQLTLLSLATGAVLLLALRSQHRRVHRLGESLSRSTQRIHTEVSEFLSGLKLAKSANAEPELARRFALSTKEARGNVLQFAQRQAQTRALLRIGAATALAVFAYAALALLSVPAATVLVLAVIFARLFPFLSQLQQHYERVLHCLPAYSGYTHMRERCLGAAEKPQGRSDCELRQAIRLERVHYRHDADAAEVLNDLSATIPAFRTTAIVGPSGAGKTTLADLLAGLIAATSGSIRVDALELADRRAWREQVAYVPQETFLFNASVRENLSWPGAKADEAELWQALDLAAADFVRALPQGLDTVLGERGIRLSGGERQRIAIARALLRMPRLLVLDEATSALDRENEQRIQNALLNLHGRLTIVVIAHRLTTVRSADQVLVLQRGRLVEAGGYAELAADPSGYLARAAAQDESARAAPA